MRDEARRSIPRSLLSVNSQPSRHLLKPMSVRLRQVLGFRSCLSLRPLRGRLVTKIRRAAEAPFYSAVLR